MSEGTIEERLVLTVEEARALCRLSRNTMYAAIARGEVPHLRVGRRILIPRGALERFLSGSEQEGGEPSTGRSLPQQRRES